MKKHFAIIASTILLSACSTITTGTTQSFTVNTPHAEGASCTLKDSRGGTWRLQQTPQTVEVTKGDGPMNVTCQKAGFKTTTLVVKEGFAGATLGNIILGGGVGVIVDAASGAAQEYPSKVSVWMEPSSWPSQAAKENWLAEKAKYEEAASPKAPSNNESNQVKSSGNFNKN